MNKYLLRLINNHHLASFAGIVLGFAVLLVPGTVFGQDFQGSKTCKSCHEAEYNQWTASGHPYKLMKGEDAKHRPIPLPGGSNWPEDGVLIDGDVSYVIGGYKWKSRYIDKDGYIITTTCEEREPFETGCEDRPGVNQYNYLTGEWVSYHAGEENKPYDCGTCHTTNWVADTDALTDNDLTDNQDGLPGMWGTFDAGGIHCEQCHGNDGGEGHMTGSGRIDKSAEACGVCHHRTAGPGAAVNVIEASGGFIKHHEQYNEFLASPHSGMECTTCHNPHKRGEYSIIKECDVCHANKVAAFAMHSMADYDVECKDCHMPWASKSANQLGEFEGDLQTHIWYINTDPEANMFTEDGTHVALDSEGKAAVTMDFACQRCHATAELTELAKFAKNFHGADTAVSELEYIGINPGLSGNWWGGLDRNGEGFLLEVAESSGAMVLIGSFYTYDTAGNQVWLIAVGSAETGMTSDVTFYINTGPKWGADFDPNDVVQEEFGTGKFTFPACDVGQVEITPNAKYMGLGFTSIAYDLSRDITVSRIACPTLVNNAN